MLVENIKYQNIYIGFNNNIYSRLRLFFLLVILLPLDCFEPSDFPSLPPPTLLDEILLEFLLARGFEPGCESDFLLGESVRSSFFDDADSRSCMEYVEWGRPWTSAISRARFEYSL